jgi:hypothetical protein
VSSNDVVLAVVDALESSAIPYMLVGAYSCNVYGLPRATQDADFVIACDRDSHARLRTALESAFRFQPQLEFETVTGTVKHILQFREHPFRVELFELSDDPHDRQRFERRRQVQQWDRDISVPTAEDVIVTKLRWARQGQRAKDIEDVRNIIAVRAERLDWDYILDWCAAHDTRELLEDIRRSVPRI